MVSDERGSSGRALPRVLDEILRQRTSEGALYTQADRGVIRCTACAHRCAIAPGRAGSCGVRFNSQGTLRVPYGYVARRYVRAIETNTVFHVLPGVRSLTFGMYGCDLRCPYCHNHRLSQALRDGPSAESPTEIAADALVHEATEARCVAICAAYNEPMISAEWTRAVFSAAKQRGLATVLVSDGNSTREALTFMRPVTDVFRVDLKAADDASYHTLGGRLTPVLDSIAVARELGYWNEVVTLVVPGFNQELKGLRALANTLREIDRDLVWHLNGFVPRYKLHETPPADPTFLISAAGTAYAAGLRFVYVGNVPGAAELAHTRCPECHTVVIRRRDYETVENRLRAGACPECSLTIPGFWGPPALAPAMHGAGHEHRT